MEDSRQAQFTPHSPSPAIWERDPFILYLCLEGKLEATGRCSISGGLHGNRSNSEEPRGFWTIPLQTRRKKGRWHKKFPSRPHFSNLEDGRGAGVTGCHQGGHPSSITRCPHLSCAFFPDSHSSTSCHHLSGGASSPVSHFFLPSPLAIHHTAPSLKSDLAPSVLQTSDDSLLTRSHNPYNGDWATCNLPSFFCPLRSFCSSDTILDPIRHITTSRPLPWLFPLLGMLFPQITTWPAPLPPSGLGSNRTAH